MEDRDKEIEISPSKRLSMIEENVNKVIKESLHSSLSSPLLSSPQKDILKQTESSEENSFFDSLWLLIAGTVGIGLFAYPYAYKLGGLVTGILLTVVGAILSIWANRCIVYCSSKRKENDYSELVVQILGNKMRIIYQLMFILYMIGSIISFQMTVLFLLQGLAQNWFGFSYDDVQKPLARGIILGPFNLIMLVFAKTELLSFLKGFSKLTCLIILYLIILVIVQMAQFIDHGDNRGTVKLFDFSENFFSAYAITAFSFMCQGVLLPIKSELKESSKDRVNKLISIAMILIFALSVALGICGYLSFLNNTPELIIFRPGLPGNSDALMKIGTLLLCIGMIVIISIRMVPLKLNILELFGIYDTMVANRLLTIVLLTLTAVVAATVESIYDVINITGGIGATIVGYVIPGVLYLKDYRGTSFYKPCVSFFLVAIATILGIGSVIF